MILCGCSVPFGTIGNQAVTEESQNSKPSNKVTQLGDFALQRELGQGGMGKVFLARQVSLDRLVAVKTLSRELSKKDGFIARFEREARAMAKIDHPNVLKIYAVDAAHGIHFAAIEYVDGQSLQKWLDQLGKLPIGDAVHLAIRCAEALRVAHAENMVHRDIKPDNILLTKKGLVKVADFGLAKAMDDDVSMTQSGTGLGTPLYMAPEQARNAKHVDERCDVYALGVTLYHMLTGQLPYTGKTTLEVIMAKEKGRYASARSLRPELSERLDMIVDKMMAKDPAQRHKSCDDVLKDLLALGVQTDALSFIAGAEAAPALKPSGNGPLTSSAPGARRAGSTSPSFGSETATQTGTRIWYVQFEDAKGKSVVEKHSTGRILKMLAAGQLSAKAKAKVSADGAYFPLAQFPEFAKAVEDSIARRSAAIRKEDMKSLYNRVERDQKMFYLKRKLKDVFRNIYGSVSLLVLLGVIGWGLWFVWQQGPELPGKVVEMIGFGEKSKQSPTEVSSGQNSILSEGGIVPEGTVKPR